MSEAAKALEPSRALYLAYNKAIADESKEKFDQRTVKCSTVHSMAYHFTVKKFGLEIGFFSYRDIRDKIPFELKIATVGYIEKFFASRYLKVADFLEAEREFGNIDYRLDTLVPKYVNMMKNKEIKCTHDFYRKLFHIMLAYGKIETREYDLIMLDEIADSPEVVIEIFKLLKAKKKMGAGDCIPGSTYILTDHGWKRMRDVYNSVNAGWTRHAISRNKDTGKLEKKRILNAVRKKYNGDFMTVGSDLNRVRATTTNDHRYLTDDGYMTADSLTKDCTMTMISTGEYEYIDYTREFNGNVVYGEDNIVYDIEVEHNHNFIISDIPNKEEVGFVVHNCNQNLYRFNHTVNGFEVLEDEATTIRLTKSFRVESSIARRIQRFMQDYINKDFKFIGHDHVDDKIETTAYISRTNAGLIEKIIECNMTKTKFNLTRKAKLIFELPMIMLTLGKQRIDHPEWKFLNADIKRWNNNHKLQEEFSLRGYILAEHADDVAIQTCGNLLRQFSPSDIINANKYATLYEKSKNHKLTITTAFSFKGGEVDHVIIADDLNMAVEKVLNTMEEKNMREPTPDIKDVLFLAYVAASRAIKKLSNAKFLYSIEALDAIETRERELGVR